MYLPSVDENGLAFSFYHSLFSPFLFHGVSFGMSDKLVHDYKRNITYKDQSIVLFASNLSS